MKRTVLYIFVFFIMIVIFIQSAMPQAVSEGESAGISDAIAALFGADPEKCDFWVRKAAHFCEYAALGFFSAMAVSCDIESKKSVFFRAWICACIWGVTDEQHQLFVQGRSCELRDVMIDSAGAAAGAAAALCIILIASGTGKYDKN